MKWQREDRQYWRGNGRVYLHSKPPSMAGYRVSLSYSVLLACLAAEGAWSKQLENTPQATKRHFRPPAFPFPPSSLPLGSISRHLYFLPYCSLFRGTEDGSQVLLHARQWLAFPGICIPRSPHCCFHQQSCISNSLHSALGSLDKSHTINLKISPNIKK